MLESSRHTPCAVSNGPRSVPTTLKFNNTKGRGIASAFRVCESCVGLREVFPRLERHLPRHAHDFLRIIWRTFALGQVRQILIR
jgi:hypothetical protein